MIREAVKQLGRIANALDHAGLLKEADILDACMIKLALGGGNQQYNNQIAQQASQNFWGGFSQLYHGVQNDANVPQQLKTDLLGIFNQINQFLGHTQASIKRQRTIVANGGQSPTGAAIWGYSQHVSSLLDIASRIPGFDKVISLLQQAQALLSNPNNTQDLQQQQQQNNTANQQALQQQQQVGPPQQPSYTGQQWAQNQSMPWSPNQSTPTG